MENFLNDDCTTGTSNSKILQIPKFNITSNCSIINSNRNGLLRFCPSKLCIAFIQ